MLKTSACPDVNQYQLFASGQLPDSEKEALLSHLEGCDPCVQKVTTFPELETLVDLLRQGQALAQRPAEETVSRLVERLSKLRPGEPQAGAEETVPPREPAASPRLTFACSACGKSLKVKAELAGKKVKCPHCKEAVRVPANAAGACAATVTHKPADKSVNKELCDFLAPAQAPDALGRLGPYRVLQVLGAGGMGVVFRAEDPHLQRLVALKAMLPGLAASDSAKQRFLREARAAAAIKHDHIVTIHQVGEDRGAPFLAMEFLEGEPLDERLKREVKLPLADVLRIGREMAEGLAAAHERGLIHRDIKPANVWLEGKKGRVKILDFGLARAADDAAHLTQSGAIVGTPAFMAPEQAQGKNVDPRCDLFSLGCVLYRMATGEAPFRGTDMISTLMAVATENPAPPISLNFELPTELSDLIMQLLAKKPEERPESAQAVAETLERMAQEQKSPKAAKTKRRQEKVKVPPPVAGRRGRRIAIAALALALLVPLGYWLSGIIVRVESKEGTLVIKTEDPSVAVKVTPEGGATLTYGKDRREIHLKPGKYGIELADAKDGLKLSTTQLTITSGGNSIVEVIWEKKLDGPGKTAEALPPTFKNNLGMEFVLVPKGEFLMGGGGGTPGTKEVTIAHDFYLGKYEVTQEEWQKITGSNPSHFSREGPAKVAVKDIPDADLKRFPVEAVSWHDAKLFLEALNETEKEAGWLYRLPKEAEWEYACRGGPSTNKFDYSFDFYFDKSAKELSPDQANFAHGKSLKRTCKVGSHKPNKLGLYDMHGNVWEWCDDSEKAGDDYARVGRGGGWDLDSGQCRAGLRSALPFADRYNRLGLRVARVPVGKEIVKVPPVPRKGPVDAAWLKEVAALSVDKQADAVTAKLKDLNPGFDGPVTREIEDGVVAVRFMCTNVLDISPLRAWPEMRSLHIAYGPLADLSPLKDIKLTRLHFGAMPVSDLTPLKDMKLTDLRIPSTPVSNLTPLKDMKLTFLQCTDTKVSDLTPLKDMKLTALMCGGSPISDLRPLKDMMLTSLDCINTQVSDLSPLKDMNLTICNFEGCPVSDLRPLKDMKLATLFCSGSQLTDAGLMPLQEMSSLRYLRIVGPKLTDSGLAHLEKLTDLDRLDFQSTKLTGAGLAHLKGMAKLRHLQLHGNAELTDEGLVHLKGLLGLRVLNLELTRVTDTGLEHLYGLRNLAELALNGTAVTDKGAAKLKAALPKCNIVK